MPVIELEGGGLVTSMTNIINRKLLVRIKQHWEIYLLLLFPLAVVIVFAYLPMAGILISFENYSFRKGYFGSSWVGIKYYVNFLTSPMFPILVKNTVVLSVYQLLAGFFLPIFLALCMNELGVGAKHFKKVAQTITYAPYFISTVVLVGILMQFFHTHVGFVNKCFVILGGKAVNFTGDPTYFRHLYVWSGVWHNCGYSAIIYISALAGVDPGLVESSVIDGANRLQKIRHIDIPCILPTIITLFILAMGRMFSIGFEKVYLMQNPLNLGQSQIISTYVYKIGLKNQQYSSATAIGVFNSIINLVLLVTANTLARRFGEHSLF